MKIKNIDWLILLFFFLLVCFLRLGSFFQSSIGDDESLYLLMARSLTEGHLPYTEIWDNKPPGIYAIFSLGLLVLGNSIISIRIITCLAISITCYLLYRLGNITSEKTPKIGVLAGILYAFLSLKNGGIASNTELFFAPFVVLAFCLLFSIVISSTKPTSQSSLKLLSIGLSMGVGLQIKQVVLFEFIAILIIISINFYVATVNNKKYTVKNILRSYCLLGLGFIIPFLFTLLCFVFTGHFQDYFYANFSANVVRVASEDLSFASLETGFLIQFQSYLILWICLFLTPIYWIFFEGVSLKEKRTLSYILIWFSMAFAGVCAPKSFYAYYFLQILPPLCLLGAYIIIKTVWSATGRSVAKNFSILALILVTPLFYSAYPYIRSGLKSTYNQYVKGIDNWDDETALISKYLAERVKQKDYIYVVDIPCIYYYLVPARIPTKYAYPPFMTYRNLPKVAGINPVQELQLIMSKKPVYIIRLKSDKTESSDFYNELNRYLKKDYLLEKNFNIKVDPFEGSKFDKDDVVELYRLRNKV